MARQLVFTSAPQGLEPGRSGYCTVSRHKDLRSRLVRELERLSVYDFNQQGDGPKAEVAIFRKLALGSEDFFVVSRIRDAGLDYTNRTNYIAHHLILDSFEIATVPSPAEILANWTGWLARWEDPPRYLDESEEVDLTNCKTLGLIPANGWLAATNDPGNAATLVSLAMKKPVVLEVHAGQEESLLKLFAESCALLKLSLDAWDYSFTTFLQENDDNKSFAWVGVRGQPAAERLKQSAPNYLDLRDFPQSNITDPIDDDLAHIARKGPKAKATGSKSPKTRAKAPKAFSDREMAQFQQAASGYTASAAPAGSTIFPQEVLSSGKKRKKRPWLMQLIVISTALCLLALLVVGLVYNFGDLLNRGGDEPDPNGIAKLPPEIDGPPDSQQGEPVVEGATLLVGKPGVVVLREKHKYMNWVKFDVGSSDPITVNLTEPQQDEYGDFLEELVEGATLQVSLARDEDGLFVLETLEPPPAVQPGGESLETNLSGEEAVVLDGSTVTFNLPGQGKLSYAIPINREELREQVESLVVHLRENPSAVAPVHLRMEGEGSERRIVAIDAIKIPEQGSVDPVPPVLPNPNKRPSVLELGNPQDFEILAGQNRVKIRIDDLGTTKYYHYAADEEQKILNLVKFLKEGGKGLKLKIEQDDDRITRLFYNDVLPGVPIPNIPVGPDPAGPMGRSPVAIYVLWLPSAQLPSKPVRWQLNLPSSGSIRYEDGQFSSSLDALLRAFDGIESARVWQANFSGPRSFYQLAENEDAFEPFGIEVDKDRVDPESRASFSLKTAGSSRSLYSLEFDVKRGGYVDVDLTADLAKNAANRGFALRIPRGSDECVDLYFISNKHLSAEHGYPPVSREKQLSLTGPTLRFSPSWPAGPRFTVLTQGKQGMYKLLLAPALGSGGTPRPDLLFSPSMPDPNAFVTGAIQGFPKALVIPKREEALACSIVMNFEYFNTYEDHFRAQINSYEADMNQKKAVLPDLEVYENLISFGQAVGKSKFVPGDDTYGEYLLKLTTSFAKEVLALDDPKTNALRAKLVKLSDPKRFHLSQSTLSQFWRTARDAMKKEAEHPLSGFGYPAERAERDVQTAFHIVNFFLHAERAFGMKDTNLADELRLARESFDSLENGLLGKLQKELLRMRGKPKAAAAAATFTESNTAYLQHAGKMVPPQALVWGEYAKAMKLLGGDPQAVALFDGHRKLLAQTQSWVNRLKAKLAELQGVRSTVIAAGGSKVQQARQRLSDEKWALALFKLNSVAGGNGQPTLERVAEIVTFR